MDKGKIIARNLKILRDANRLSAEQMSSYLGIGRSTYANYESGLRNVPLEVLLKASDIFGCELSVFFEEDDTKVKTLLQCAFRVDGLCNEDIKEIARFKAIAMNYLKIKNIEAK